MTHNEIPEPSDELVQFFLPQLARHLEAVTGMFARVEKKELEDTVWFFIPNKKQSGKFLNHHFLSQSWEEVEGFLKQRTKLYCFLEEKKQGLLGNSYRFWTFFSPATAADFFKNQVEKPKNFSAQAIRSVPFPKLQDAFLESFASVMEDAEVSSWQKLEKTADILKLSDKYLQKDSVAEVDNVVKRKIIRHLGPEITKLQEEIFGANAATTIMARRLRSVLRIGWRYFRAKNELETKYFRKLLAEEAEERIKGLKLAKKKLIDFELEMAE